MTTDKARKRAIRNRMRKTGEAYTTARRHLLEHHPAEPAEPKLAVEMPAAPEAEPQMPSRVAEPLVGDETVQRATGRDWDGWLRLLDGWGAQGRTHAEIARYLASEHGISGWWAQNVTVGYERMRGLRAVHEHADGYSVGASKTFPVPVERLYAAFADDAQRAAWLEPELFRVRSAREHKVWRCEAIADGSRIEVGFTAKSPEKSSAAVEHARLASADEVVAWRAFWKERLERLATLLTTQT